MATSNCPAPTISQVQTKVRALATELTKESTAGDSIDDRKIRIRKCTLPSRCSERDWRVRAAELFACRKELPGSRCGWRSTKIGHRRRCGDFRRNERYSARRLERGPRGLCQCRRARPEQRRSGISYGKRDCEAPDQSTGSGTRASVGRAIVERRRPRRRNL